MPSTGLRSAASIASEKSLPKEPMSAVMMASAPANGPSPTTLIQISAHTRMSTLRMVSSERRDEEAHHALGGDVARGQQGQRQGQYGRRQRAEEGDGDGLEQRHAERPRMRPAARVGRQHQADDLDQARASGEQRAAEEAELRHAEQQQGESRDARQQGQQALAVEAGEMLRMAVSDGDKIDRGTALHQRLSSRPIS